MINALIGQKQGQTQAFLEDGTRVPVSLIRIAGNTVVQHKTQEKEGYMAVQIGFDSKRKSSKAELQHAKKAGIEKAPRFLKEVKVDDVSQLELGSTLKAEEVFEAGDFVDVLGVSKGKGYAGVVKRHHFKGGPRTHGQSDRERAPGSIGQTTTPGRVYKGKRMAGHMGVENVTIKNLTVLKIDGDTLLVKGLIPGARGSMVVIEKLGKNKKFVPIFERKEAVVEEVAVDSKEAEAIVEAVQEGEVSVAPVEAEAVEVQDTAPVADEAVAPIEEVVKPEAVVEAVVEEKKEDEAK